MLVQQVGSPSAIRILFGPFELNVAERSLKKANQVIPLGGRAYDILIALLESAGEVVEKAELIARAWPDVTVEEGSLRVHLSALRKALGDGQFGNKEHLVGAIASAVGLDDPQLVDSKEVLLNFLRPRRVLIILDGCEHLVEKTAEIADYIFQNAPDIYILATSREALHVPGERVLRLCPLDCPPEQPGLTVPEVLAYPAARLFVERISARGGDFSLSDDETPMVAENCRQLDGIALANAL